jgi:uncharacterized membrane protein YfcA
MADVFSDLSGVQITLGLAVAVLAGIVKGVVGFAMPMILISGLSSFLAPGLALAGLILPTLVTNGMQALRQGPRAAAGSVMRFRWFLAAGLGALLVSSQLVAVLPGRALLLLIGAPVMAFAVLQLLGWRPGLAAPSLRLEIGIGAVAGFIGGVSGVWGPPTVAYLTALGTRKGDQMRVQGVIYGLGAAALAAAHLGSGVLNRDTVWLSLALVPPAVAGMWLGGLWQNRIDQRAFRRATLIVLAVAGANLVRRAMT